MVNYTLSLVSGADVHTWDNVELIDVFSLKADGEELFQISFQWDTEDSDAIAKVIRKCSVNAASLTGMSGPFALVGHVQATLDKALYEIGGEFYAECFVDEDGDDIEVPISFNTTNQ